MNLPPGWTWTTLGETCEINLGQSPPSSTYNDHRIGLPFYQGSGEFGELYPTVEKWCTKPKKVAESGDILLSVRAPVGPTNICQEQSAIGRGLAAIRYPFPEGHRFLFYFFRSIESSLSQTGTGSTFSAITKSEIHNLPLPLPPLPEQRRIVAKVEELFSKLDAGVEALRKIKAELKRYRQSVLKHAFEGRLTEEYRRGQRSEVGNQLAPTESGRSEVTRIAAEPRVEYASDHASALLARIRDERRKTSAKGGSQPDRWLAGASGGKYKEPAPIDTSELPELPEGWAWAKVGEIADSIQYGFTASAVHEKVGPKFLRITDIQNGNVDWNDVPYCDVEGIEKKKYLVKEGDLVFARTGATVGKSYLIKKDVPEAVFASYLIRIRVSADINRNFLYSFFQSTSYWRQISETQVGIGQPNVNGTKLAQIVLPLAPVPEQQEIVSEIDRRFSITDQTEKTVDEGLLQAERLRQSILKRAFEGRLVEQDSLDEPAELLLGRIKTGRENVLKSKSKNQKGKQRD